MKVSDRTHGVEYAIRDITAYANKFRAQGKEIIYLNIGDPVKFDFPTPEHIKRALIDAVSKNENYYADSEGLPELRKAIVEKESEKGLDVTEDDVIVTNGVSEGLDMALASIVDPNSEVLMPGPYYPPYSSYVKFYGGKPVEFRLHEDGRPDLEDLRKKITPRSRALCIISPNNPTGEVFDRKSLQQLIDIATEHDLYVICDEIYDKITFDSTFTGIGKVAKDAPVVLLNGFSKAYLMTGWRCGYICMNSSSRKLDQFREDVPKLARVRIATNLPVQIAAVQALRGPQDHIPVMVEKLRKRRDLVVKRLNGMGIQCRLPRGAFYAFPRIELGSRWKDDKQFVIELLNGTGVLTVHGSGFGVSYGSGHFRIVYLPPEDVLERAMDKLEKFVKS
ncbi:aminotransferase class I/II-fold pyridoxal phosphate-dependent enzyme [Nitrososphaera viennensis]|uniref:Aminotransferase n=2 Tax=Nitrososphaera viennensis TaxID=1034015 RepID=A0A060HKI3_9ARCH|nr:aminotransferase class I/II-fold pyridoxal phosphate-dependent enzyme [Nitrososphaera viennensis]AIC17024.1 aminotransferase [Nitrososphaera viennensis EN76]UVS68921.1 aminotransferase class I/II-fold pyridoxal phosphate-dependent enzyme [Nitrososphaera viennensis]